jgi:hypothetical protein
MTYLWALLLGVLEAGLGFVLGFAAADALAPALGVTSFEGASRYFALFVGGPVGALVGFVVGSSLVLWRAGHRRPAALTGRVALVGAGAVAIAALVLGGFWFLRPLVNADGPAPRLVFEIRLPPGLPPLAAAGPPVELQTDKNRMPAALQAGRRDGDREVIIGTVDLYYRTWQRMLVLTMPDKTDVLFDVPLGLTPGHTKGFGEWRRADYIAHGDGRARHTAPSEAYDVRYRVDWPGED